MLLFKVSILREKYKYSNINIKHTSREAKQNALVMKESLVNQMYLLFSPLVNSLEGQKCISPLLLHFLLVEEGVRFGPKVGPISTIKDKSENEYISALSVRLY